MRVCVIVGYILMVTFAMTEPAVARTVLTSPQSCSAYQNIPDLSSLINQQIDQRINLSTVSDVWRMNTYRSYARSLNSIAVKNRSLWTSLSYPIDFTGVSGLNDAWGNIGTQKGATLISPRHVLEATHFSIPVGYHVVFYDAQGNPVVRTIIDSRFIGGQDQTQPGYTDITVALLDQDVPDSITYYPVISDANLEGLLKKYDTQLIDVPIVHFNQLLQISVDSLAAVSAKEVDYSTYTQSNRKNFSMPIVIGDSGQPVFMLIDNQAVLLSANYEAGFGASSGPNYGGYINEINAAMSSLGGGYQLTEYNNTCFVHNPSNAAPVWKAIPNVELFVYDRQWPSSLFTYIATDQDVNQKLTYFLSGLSSKDNKVLFNPSDYFLINPRTGELKQIASMDIDKLGAFLTLSVSVKDNALNPVTINRLTTIHLRKNLNSPAQIILDPLFNNISLGDGTPRGSGVLGVIRFDNKNRLILAGHFSSVDGRSQNSVSRLNSNGSLDLTFGKNIGKGAKYKNDAATINKIVLDHKNRILLASTYQDNFNDVNTGAITRLVEDGAMDLGFASNSNASSSGSMTDINLFYDGTNNVSHVIAGGSFQTGQSVLMFKEDGTFDEILTNNIAVTRPVLTVDSLGNIYLGGWGVRYAGPDGILSNKHIAKLNKQGVPDPVFTTNISSGFNSFVREIAIRPDGKIVVVGGFTGFKNIYSPSIALLNSDGTLDNEFTKNIGSGFDGAAIAVNVQRDNKMIIGGAFKSFNNIKTNALVRLNADGTLDTSFQDALQYGVTNYVSDIAARSDGTIAIMGDLNDINGSKSGPVAVLKTRTPQPPVFLGAMGGNIKAISKLTLSGKGQKGAIVKVYQGTGLLGSAVVDSNGEWQLPQILTAGNHSLSATQEITFTNTAVSSRSPVVNVNVGYYNLNINVSGLGKVKVKAVPSSNNSNYLAGTKVILEANANAGNVFAGWSGDLRSSASSESFTINKNVNVLAIFNKKRR